MSISTRGPDNILVVDRTCVAVKDVCDAVVKFDTVNDITTRMQVSELEIFECIDTYQDVFGPNESDFVDFEWINRPNEMDDVNIDVTTTGVSPWVYISVLSYGVPSVTSERTFSQIYNKGLENIFLDCFNDIIAGSRDFEEASPLHNIIFGSFEKTYGIVNPQRAQELLYAWDN